MQCTHKRSPWLLLSLAVIIIDWVSKWAVVRHLDWGQSMRLTSFFDLRLVYNSGAAFSFLGSQSGWQMLFFTVLAIIVVVVLLIWMYRAENPTRIFLAAMTLIVGGALGNAADRLMNGMVTDFFDFHVRTWHFAIFNVADIAITIGVIFLIADWVCDRK